MNLTCPLDVQDEARSYVGARGLSALVEGLLRSFNILQKRRTSENLANPTDKVENQPS